MRTARHFLIGCMLTHSAVALHFKNIDQCFSYDAKQHCRSHLKAKRAIIDLTKRRIEAFDIHGTFDQHGYWRIRADHALYLQKKKMLYLKGHCVLTLDDPRKGHIIYKGKNFVYSNRTKVLISHDIIDIFNNHQHMQAKGIEANIKTKKVRMLSQVSMLIPQ